MSKLTQKPSLAKMISTMNRIYNQHMAANIGIYDLNMTHLSIIMGLYDQPGTSLNIFSQEKKINKAILSKALKVLQARGLVTLEKDENHKQKFKIYITDEAKELVPILRRSLRHYEKISLSPLSVNERETFLTLFEKVFNHEID
jgi:DNA-binding MarR family transcriptional regulator